MKYAFVVLLSAQACLPTAWGTLSQEERDGRIVERGSQDIGRNVGKTCKEWIRDVVQEASDDAAEVPLTCIRDGAAWRQDLYGWYWCPSGSTCPVSVRINDARPGWIVQMRRFNTDGTHGPHTAIVLRTDVNGLWWLDSNWVAPTTVGTHYETFADFERAVCTSQECYYTIYQLTGH